MTRKKTIGKKLKTIRISQGHKAGSIERLTQRKLRNDQIKAMEKGEANYTIDSLLNYADFLGLQNFEI